MSTSPGKRKRSVKKKPAVHPRVHRSTTALRNSLQLLLKRKSLEKISIRDIAAGAEVGYTTFFRHYPTKEALLDDLAQDEIDQLMELTAPIFDPDNTQSASRLFCEYVEGRRELWSALLTGAAGTMRAALIKRARAMVVNYPRPVAWLPAELGTTIVASSIIEILSWWLSQKKLVPVAQVAEILDKVAIYPISHD